MPSIMGTTVHMVRNMATLHLFLRIFYKFLLNLSRLLLISTAVKSEENKEVEKAEEVECENNSETEDAAEVENEEEEGDEKNDSNENKSEVEEEEKENGEEDQEQTETVAYDEIPINLNYNKYDDEPEIIDLDEDLIKRLLCGDVFINIPSQVKIVRIFTSSTFTDTFNERNALMIRVYPKLKEYCQAQGYDFQVVDMRWGVRDEATADHMTSQLCMREIKSCQDVSTGPNFITFLAQKYGYRPFPARIAASEFDRLLQNVGSDDDKDLLGKWFIRDENICPPTFLLQPITNLLPSYNNHSVSKEERSAASNEWWTAFERMQIVLREAALKVKAKDPTFISEKYFMSVTEDEIERGILRVKDPKKKCYWFYRQINNLEDNLGDKSARNFMDKIGDNKDEEAYGFLKSLKEDRMEKVLPADNIKKYDLQWQTDVGIDPDQSSEHAKYLNQLCSDFQKELISMINEGMKDRQQLDIDDDVLKEVCQHVTICREKSKVFKGREDILGKIADYIDSTEEDAHPFVVHGESGCGKTAIMAKAAYDSSEKNITKHIQVLRFLGTTSDSSSLMKLLYSVCCQVKKALEEDVTDVPKLAKPLKEYFLNMISDDIRDKEDEVKVVMFIDSIDQLSPDDGAFLMKWLPKSLPSNVRIVVSTLPDVQFGVLDNLMVMLPSEMFQEVSAMSGSTASEIVTAWLQDCSRQLTSEQMQIVMDAYDKCPLPLFLKLAFDEACRWNSYTKAEDLCLESSIQNAIATLFGRLERLHGKVIVTHALGAITASCNGLSDAEIDDILSIDDDVLNDVYQYWTPPARRIPPLLWLRIRADLGSYMSRRGANGVLVNTWYHRQFKEAAAHRYLDTGSKALYHALLYEYFIGKWGNGALKPFQRKNGEEGSADRLVPFQPNIYSEDKASIDIFNFRKLSELPSHITSMKEIDILKDHVIFNYDFLLAKLRAIGYAVVLDDVLKAVEAFPSDKETKLIYEFFKISGRSLLDDPYQLPAQLLGRLQGNTMPNVVKLLEAAKYSNVPCLYPSLSCFPSPDGRILFNLIGHEQVVNHASFSIDGQKLLSTGSDSTVRVWDLETGRQLRCLEQENGMVMVFPTHHNDCAVLISYAKILCQNILTEEVYYNHNHGCGARLSADISKDFKNLVVMGQENVCVFDCAERNLTLRYKSSEAIQTSESPMSNMMWAGEQVFAYTRGNDKEINIRSIYDEKYKNVLKTPRSIITFQFSPNSDRFFLLSTSSSMTETYMKIFLSVYDASTWKELTTYETKDPTHIIITLFSSSLWEGPAGLELVWPTMYRINFWNVETGAERCALKSGYQGTMHKQALCKKDSSMVVVSMDANSTAIPVYDMNEVEFEVINVATQELSDIEKAEIAVGNGEREMYHHFSDPYIVISIPSVASKLKLWNVKTNSLFKVMSLDGMISSDILAADANHYLLWIHNKQAILTVNIAEGVVIAETQGKISDTPSSFHQKLWAIVEGTDLFAVLDGEKLNINLFNWKTGILQQVIKTEWLHPCMEFITARGGRLLIGAPDTYKHPDQVYPLDVFDISSGERVTQLKQEKSFDIRKQFMSLPESGEYLFVIDQNASVVKVWEIATATIVETIQVAVNSYANGVPLALTSSSETGYLLVMFMCAESRGNITHSEYRLISYEFGSWKKCSEIISRGYISSFELSSNGERLLATTQAAGELKKVLTLYDMKNFRDEIKEVGNLFPETDTLFTRMSRDGDVIIVGLSGIDGITFFRVCGDVVAEQRTAIEPERITLDRSKFDSNENTT